MGWQLQAGWAEWVGDVKLSLGHRESQAGDVAEGMVTARGWQRSPCMLAFKSLEQKSRLSCFQKAT